MQVQTTILYHYKPFAQMLIELGLILCLLSENVFFRLFDPQSLLDILTFKMSSKPRTDDDIIALLQEASGSMKTAQFEAALKVFQEILAETDNPNVPKFAASVQGMLGECLFSLARIPYVHYLCNGCDFDANERHN
jgi:hypothetical protein